MGTGPFCDIPVVLHQYLLGPLGSLPSELQVTNPDAGHPPPHPPPPRTQRPPSGSFLSPGVTSGGYDRGAGPFSELTLALTLGTQELCSAVTYGSLPGPGCTQHSLEANLMREVNRQSDT